MPHLLIPKIECVETQGKFGRFVAEPLSRGFGITLGNSLRRVLLSSLPGAAVNWVRIEGLQHEFSTIPHVKEDVMEFLLNVKSLRLRPLTNRPGKLYLEAVGERRVCAADIKPSADFDIANPELHLATLDSAEARLYVEFNVELGKGYVPATHGNGSIGMILVDAIFTPVHKVDYSVEPTRIGQQPEYEQPERLILNVWTDGTISASEALTQGAKILMEQLSPFTSLFPAPREEIEERLAGISISSEEYNLPLERIGLSPRTFNCLRRNNFTKLGELLERSEEELLSLRKMGQKSLEEIKQCLEQLGFTLSSKEKTEQKITQPPPEIEPEAVEEHEA